jgi:hypothetical protein
LANIHTIGEQLEPDFQAWEEAHEELDLLYRIYLDNNRRAKLALTVWGRAHQKMASGVKNMGGDEILIFNANRNKLTLQTEHKNRKYRRCVLRYRIR